MQRRYLLYLLSMLGLSSLSACSYKLLSKYWPDNHQFFNPCLNSQLPAELAQHEVILSALAGIDTTQVWDSHVHLLGLGDTNSGIWINPHSRQWFRLKQYVQFRFFLNAACPLSNQSVDESYVARLKQLYWGPGSRLLLLAFDHSYDEQGNRLQDQTAFYVPNHYAAQIYQHNPETFEWLASVHPYRPDCVEALEKAFVAGARGVKWLPPAMGMNPASPLCDRFYTTLVAWNKPLLCHCGDEQAVSGTHTQPYGNPLALRRALDHGVKVVMAHCASLGSNPDIDKGPHGPPESNFTLFTRLMGEARYENLLFADISALSQTNRVGKILDTVITRQDWHHRLLYGSDYPLPGVLPVTSLKLLQEKQYITNEQASVLAQVRQHNSLLFDFLLQRHLQVQGQRFSKEIFHSRSFWTHSSVANS